MNIKILTLIYILTPALTMAGGASSRDPMQLFYGSVLNVAIVAAIFIWKGRPQLKLHFENKHEQILETSKKAQTQKFEAQMLLENQEKKNNSLSDKLNEIKKTAEDEVQSFKKQKMAENEKSISALQSDAKSKVKMAESEVINKINKDLLDQIISKAKSKVKGDPTLQNKVTETIIKGLN